MAAVLSIVAALFYGFNLLKAKRQMKEELRSVVVEEKVDKAHLFAGFVYYNPNDSRLFIPKYIFNFANKWVYLLLASLIAYPLLVLSAL